MARGDFPKVPTHPFEVSVPFCLAVLMDFVQRVGDASLDKNST
jgi:hypothetical protein